jgi:regulator of RNase E activity RraA
MSIVRAAVLAVCIGVLAACMTVGTKFDINKVDQLKPGVSTMEDATQLLGPAKAVSTMANNSKLLQWQYVQGTPVGGSGSHVAILFDATGKMVRVTHRSVQ